MRAMVYDVTILYPYHIGTLPVTRTRRNYLTFNAHVCISCIAQLHVDCRFLISEERRTLVCVRSAFAVENKISHLSYA